MTLIAKEMLLLYMQTMNSSATAKAIDIAPHAYVTGTIKK
jgi:hypothetical protein